MKHWQVLENILLCVRQTEPAHLEILSDWNSIITVYLFLNFVILYGLLDFLVVGSFDGGGLDDVVKSMIFLNWKIQK